MRDLFLKNLYLKKVYALINFSQTSKHVMKMILEHLMSRKFDALLLKCLKSSLCNSPQHSFRNDKNEMCAVYSRTQNQYILLLSLAKLFKKCTALSSTHDRSLFLGEHLLKKLYKVIINCHNLYLMLCLPKSSIYTLILV